MKTRRYLAWIVTALLLLTSFALPAPQAAAEAEAMSLDYLELPALAAQETPELKGEQTKGQCGPNLYWSFNASTGELTITGSGFMSEYGPDAENPLVKNWISAEIKSVSLPKGMTDIDAYGFFGCEALTSIELPDTVKVIGEGAFKQCTNLRTITIPKKVATINASAFEGCANLKEVRYEGKQDDRVKIRILQGNDPLLKATWRYAKDSSAALAIKTQPKNLSVKEGANATFKVKVTGATTIQWQYRSPNGSTWYDTGVTSTSLIVRGSYSVNGYYFRCKVSNGYYTLYSNEAQLTVKLVPLTIKTHPKTIKANLGKTVTFKIKATGASHYEWQVKFPNDSSWYVLENTNTPNISLTVNRSDYDGLQFRCVVSNDRGEVKYSNAGKLCIKIKVTQKPKAVKVAEGDLAKFTVAGTGYTGIQWQYMWPGEKVWRNVDGGVYETCTILVKASYNKVAFRAALYNNTSVKYTSKAKLTVVASKLAFTSHPSSVTVNDGEIAKFSVAVRGATSLQWQYKWPGESTWYDVGNATGTTCSIKAQASYDGVLFRCKASNSTSTIYSNTAKLTVKPNDPVITKQPVSVTVYEGETAKFTVAANNADSYQWQYQWAGESTWYDVGNATGTTCSIQAKASYDGMLFRCKITGNGHTVYSNTAKLTVKVPLAITSHPQSVTVYEGEKATFSVSATGATSYQWQYQSPSNSSWNDLEDTNYSGISLTTKLSFNGYRFRCKVSNGSSTLYSNAATLTVKEKVTYWALLIGENDYPGDSALEGCVNDMNTMAGMLRGLKNSFSVQTLPNSTRSQIMNALSTAFAGATDDSVSLFYFSGHGLNVKDSPTDQNQGALSPIDRKEAGYITFSTLASTLSQVKGRVIVILDSCHSGAAIGKSAISKQEMEQQIKAYNQAAIAAFSGYRIAATEEEVAKYGELATSKFIVITAAKSAESSYDGSYDGSGYDQGRFTAAVIKGMGCTYPNGTYSGSMPADKNGDKQITLKELYDYAYNTALNWGSTAQHAQYYGSDSEVMFTR